MTAVRGLQGPIVVAALVLAFLLSSPHARPDYEIVPGDSVTVDLSEEGSTWYCATGASGAQTHTIRLVNAGDDDLTATVTSLGHEQSNRAESVHDVAAGLVVDVDLPRGAVVEFNGPGGTVWEQLDDETGFATAPCRRDSSPQWHFGAADSTTGADAIVWLLNPFPTDASVSVIVSTPDGTRTPGALDGIVLPGGTSRPVTLDDSISVRPQFSLTVETLAGRVIASLAQSADGTGEPEDGSPARRGIGILEGAASPGADMVFADGVSGEGTTERYVLYNPGDDAVSVEVSVVPADTDESLLPEPFDLEVPAGRYSELVMSAESRVPVGAVHSVRVRAEGTGIVATRVTDIFDGGGDGIARPPVGAGMALATGRLVESTDWILPRSAIAESDLVVARNLSEDSIGLLTVSVVAAGVSTDVATDVEVSPGSVVAVPVVSDAAAGPVLVRVTSTESTTVEYRAIEADAAAFSIKNASPVAMVDDEDA